MVKTSGIPVELLEEVGQIISTAAKGLSVEIDGTPKLSVKRKDGEYRYHPMVSGQEFFYLEHYVGKSEHLIFVFDPVDAQPYKTAEVPSPKLDDVFPLLAGGIAKKLGFEVEAIADLIAAVANGILMKREAAKREAQQAAEHHPLFGRF